MEQVGDDYDEEEMKQWHGVYAPHTGFYDEKKKKRKN